MKYADIKECDIANGPGVRVSLFVSGCNRGCKGCFNEAAWDFNYGEEYTEEIEDRVMELLKRPYIEGLSLLGGDPMEPQHQDVVASLVERVRRELPEKSIWCYSGFIFDTEIMRSMYKFMKPTKRILNNIDVMIDGRWVEDLYDPGLRYRGSSNQRIIDVPKSLKQNKIVLWDMEYGR